MDLLQNLLPSQSNLVLISHDLDTANHRMVFSVRSTQVVTHCPLCNCPTHRIHSQYERTLKDIPLVQFNLTILLAVCKFFCLNEQCRRRIFTERLPDVVAPWARRTHRYSEKLKALGLALGGSAASRLSHQLGYGTSRQTILRLLSKLPVPEIVTPKILGVDDFALRKGHHYGTILVDLEHQKPIALLPDRTAETLEAWLKEHPGVEILSRDRSKTYRRGMNNGAPDAIQVADRFHLLQNLQEVIEKVFRGQTSVLKRVEREQLKSEGITLPESKTEAPASSRQLKKNQNRARRLEKYEQSHILRKQGHQIKDIAHHLGIGERTVYTYLSHSTFPEYQVSSRQYRSVLDPYKPYLIEQWNQGRHQTKALFREIQQQGYQSTYATVTRFTKQLRQLNRETLNHLVGQGPAPKVKPLNQKPLSARRAAWLVLRREDNRDAKQEKLFELLCQQPELSATISLAQDFMALVRQRLPKKLDDWLDKAKNSSIKAFENFAKSIGDDYDAVKAGVTLEVSNGQVEGQNNRLKMLKRQMFGRAGLDLLAKRFILT